jgi:hypothetical protein
MDVDYQGPAAQPPKALLISEIQSIILSYTNPEDLARLARVSKLFTDSALNKLYCTLDNLLGIFAILAPCEVRNGLCEVLWFFLLSAETDLNSLHIPRRSCATQLQVTGRFSVNTHCGSAKSCGTI